MFERESAVVLRNCVEMFQYLDGEPVAKKYGVVAEFDGNIYVGAENGLFVKSGDRLVPAALSGGDITANVVDIKTHGNAMYVATKASVYSVSREMVRSVDYLQSALRDNRIPSAADVVQIAVSDGCVYLGTTLGVYCFQPAPRPCIYEILTDGSTAQLPREAATGSFDDVTDICFAGNALLVGTESGLFRLDMSGRTTQNTSQIMSISKYADSDGASVQAGKRMVKLLAGSVSPYVYIITEDGVCRADDIDGHRWLVPGGSGELVADAQFAQVEDVAYVFVVTNKNAYLLSPDYLVVKATPGRDTPGVACCCNDEFIAVARPDGKCAYTHNSIDKFKSSSWNELDKAVDRFAVAADGVAYGLSGGESAARFSCTPAPTVASGYSGVSDWSWSSALSGYAFVREGRLVYRQFACRYEMGSDGEPSDVHFDISDDVSVWYSGEDANAVYVCDSIRSVFLGTQTGLLSASFEDVAKRQAAVADIYRRLESGEITGEQASSEIDGVSPAFGECPGPDGAAARPVCCICRGYTAESEHGPAYSSWSYTAVKVVGDDYVEDVVDSSSGESILFAASDGLLELKLDGDGQIEARSSTSYKAMCSTPSLFVGVA